MINNLEKKVDRGTERIHIGENAVMSCFGENAAPPLGAESMET